MVDVQSLIYGGIGLVVLAIVLAVGGLVTHETQTLSVVSGSSYFANTTVTPVAPRNVTVGRCDNLVAATITLASCIVYNASNGYVIPTTNYSLYEAPACTLKFRLSDGRIYNKSAKTVYCPYTGTVRDFDYNITEQGLQAQSTMGGFIGIVAILLVVIAVLGALMFMWQRNG